MNNQNTDSQTTPVSPENPNASSWQLIALSPQLGDLTIDIGNSLSIGRSDTNDVVLATPQVSRQHAKINRIGDKIYVQDLGSANGTFVNGERIDTQALQLQATDEIAFADLAFLVHTEDFADIHTEEFLNNLHHTLLAPQPSSPVNIADDQSQSLIASVPATTANSQPLEIITSQDTPDRIMTSSSQTDDKTDLNKDKVKEIYAPSATTSNDTKQTIDNKEAVAKSLDLTQPINAQKTVAAPTIDVDTNSSITTAAPQINSTLKQKHVNKKNYSIAILIIIIIILIVIATLILN